MGKKGFTLIEVLVVIAVIGILAAILFPVFTSARHQSQQATCASNLKQIAMAIRMYTDDYNGFVSRATIRDASGNVLCYAENWGKYYWMFTCRDYIARNVPTDYENKKQCVFVCPAMPLSQRLENDSRTRAILYGGDYRKWGLKLRTDSGGNPYFAYWCSYAINEHLPGQWPNLSEWSAPSRSFMILEANDSEIEGDELIKLAPPPRYQLPHSDGLNIAYIDGHVKWAKAVYEGQLSQRYGVKWKFPPPGGGGDFDSGPWTAPAGD